MNSQPTLADLLASQMKKCSVGDSRLANMVNTIAENNHFINRSTIRNWRDGTSKKVNYPQQLVAVAVVLRLNETEADALLQSGGCPSLAALRVSENEADKTFLSFWNNAPLQDPALGANPQVASDGNTAIFTTASRAWQLNGVNLLTLASLAAVVGIVSSGLIHKWGNSSTLDEINVNENSAIPVLRPVTLGRQCLIDLAVQPTGKIWGHGESSDCPELIIFHQYGEYSEDDLLAWNKGTAQCFVTTSLERMWIAFDLSSGGEGWLRLTWFGSGAPYFKEDEPVKPTLWASPEPGSKIVGTFGYEELAGHASKVLLDFPEILDSAKAFEDGNFHLGGCWQKADRDQYKGIHFYWPKNTRL